MSDISRQNSHLSQLCGSELKFDRTAVTASSMRLHSHHSVIAASSLRDLRVVHKKKECRYCNITKNVKQEYKNKEVLGKKKSLKHCEKNTAV
jgi:biotin synthase-like enzyme